MICRFLLALWASVPLLLAQRGDRDGEIQEPPPSHWVIPPSPVQPAEEALKSFRLAPGFRIELVAADPLVRDPVAMAIGPDGRIWVVEMRGFMPNADGDGEDQPVGTVSVLEDTDGDGRMDKRTEFASGLVMPRALALVDGGVLVAAPPYLWLFRDRSGRGVADEIIEVSAEYGDPANPEHTDNGLMWALDNWIYNAKSTVRFRYEGENRFRRETTLHRGQWGITQDDLGRLYYNSNSDPLRVDLIPFHYLRRHPHLPPAGTNVQLAPATLPVWPGRVTPGVNRGYKNLRPDGTLPSVTATCGPVIYRGTLFPAEFAGNAFIAEPSANLIKRLVLREDAAAGTMEATNAYEHTEFLTSTDERFRPVNLYNGPDGALYVVDLYRGILQHRIYMTTFLRRQVEARGLDRGIGLGRIYRIVPASTPRASFAFDLTKASAAELVERLDHPEGWWRDTAQRLLVERRDPAAPAALRTLARSARHTTLGRLHALWTLEGLGEIDRDTLLAGLADPDPRLQAAALRLAEGSLRDPTIYPAAAALATPAAAPAVTLQLALSLGEAGTPAADALLRRLVQTAPRNHLLATAALSGLAGREQAFVQALFEERTPQDTPPPALAVALATTAVLKSGQPARIDLLLAGLAPDAPTPAWGRQALLEGVRDFLPRNREGELLTGKLAVEPRGLVALADASAAPERQRAGELLARLTWPGKPGADIPQAPPLTAAQQARFEQGRAHYATICAACHQPEGQGLAGLAPPLVNSTWALGDARVLARIVLSGKERDGMIMPPMSNFDDNTLAAILTVVRRSWGHQASAVAPAVITEARQAVAGRHEPWSEADLATLSRELSTRR